MRVFLDSNVLVSGIAFRGNEHAVLRLAFAPGHHFVLSEDVRDEVLRGLLEKFPSLRAEAMELLVVIRAEIQPRMAYTSGPTDFPGLRDPRDAHVLAAALTAECDLIVTGDKDLLRLGRVGRARIVRPREALRILGPDLPGAGAGQG